LFGPFIAAQLRHRLEEARYSSLKAKEPVMLLAKGVWVVVADGEKALIFENQGNLRSPNLKLIEREEADMVMPGADTDRPGRLPDPGPGQRSAMEQPDYGRLIAERFVGELLAQLKQFAAKGRFDKLVLVAPPQVLGAMRAEMDPPMQARVLAEVPKTLTRHPAAKIGALIAAEIDAL
jgi:protein required for attachment to host cells